MWLHQGCRRACRVAKGNEFGKGSTQFVRSATYSTTAEPSLRRDSPSIKVPIAFSVPSSLRRATTATGSVAEVIVPMSQHTWHG